MKRMLPPTYFLLALISMVALHSLWPMHRLVAFPATLGGLVPLALGIALNLLADREFRRHRTTVRPFERSTALVTRFPFSVSRHPMYLGLTLMLVGIWLLLGSITPAVPAIAFALLMDCVFVRTEERMLAEQFAEAWDQYRSRVRRWV
jgi:protein-S-isoprenylcysteine O-methyltransferase Ste14